MPSDELVPLASGLKPTLRQLMILVIWAGGSTAGLSLLLSWGFFTQPVDEICLELATGITMYATFLACFLLLFLDRRGPVRSWYIGGCQACGLVLTAGSFLCMDLVCYVLIDRPSFLFPFAPVFGLLAMCACGTHLRGLWPGRCQCCGQQAVLSTGKTVTGGPIYRKKVQGWCAACGQFHERVMSEPWTLKA